MLRVWVVLGIALVGCGGDFEALAQPSQTPFCGEVEVQRTGTSHVNWMIAKAGATTWRLETGCGEELAASQTGRVTIVGCIENGTLRVQDYEFHDQNATPTTGIIALADRQPVLRTNQSTRFRITPERFETKARSALGHKARVYGTFANDTVRVSRMSDLGVPRCGSSQWVGTGKITCSSRVLGNACAPTRPIHLDETVLDTRPAETVTTVEGPRSVYDWPRDVDAAAQRLALAIDRAGTAAADVIVGKSPIAIPPFTSIRTAHEAFLTARRAPTAPLGPVEKRLLEIAVRFAVINPPFAAYPLGYDKVLCPPPSAHHDGVSMYLKGVAVGNAVVASRGAMLLNGAMHCMTLKSAVLVNDAFANLLEPFESLPTQERRGLFAALLPATLIVLDATKHLGNTRLMRHVARSFKDYGAAFSDTSSTVWNLGVWLPSSVSLELRHAKNFCEPAALEGCISGNSLLKAVVDPLAVGLGDCGLAEVVDAGLDTYGAYSCRAGMCVAAAQAQRRTISSLPLGIEAAIASGQTPLGVPLGDSALLSSCGLRGGGSAGGGITPLANTMPKLTGCALAPRGGASFRCVANGAPAGALSSQHQNHVPTGDRCTKVTSAQTDGTTSKDTTAAPPATQDNPQDKSNEPEVKKAKEEAVKNLRDPEIRKAVATTLKNIGLTEQEIYAAMDVVAIAIQSGALPIQVIANGVVGDKLGDVSIAGLFNQVGIYIDWDAVEAAKSHPIEDDGNVFGRRDSLGNVVMHEVMHAVFDALGLSKLTRPGSDEQHFWMSKAGVSWQCAGPQPRCSKLCGADSDCGSDCSATSYRLKTLAQCFPEPKTERVPAPIDPDPINGTDPTMKACFATPAMPPISNAPACKLIRCPDGAASVLKTGDLYCSCSQGVPEATGFWVAGCGALRCSDGVPTASPTGCSCPAGLLSVNGTTLQLTRAGHVYRAAATR